MLNIIEEKPVDEVANRMIEEFSDSNEDSLTEKNISIGSDEMGQYGPDYEKEKIEIYDPKKELNEEEKKRAPPRPRTPPKTDTPLISNFGPKTIPLSKPKDSMSKTSTFGGTRTPMPAAGPRQGNQTATNLQVPSLSIERMESSKTPLQSPLKKDSSLKLPGKEESKSAPGPEEESKTPKEGNLLTPNLGGEGGFTGGEFAKALKDAKDTKDYNFLKYD